MPQGPPLVEERPFLIMDSPRGVATIPIVGDLTPAVVWQSIIDLAERGHHCDTWWSIAWATESRLVHYRSEHRRNT